MAQPGVENHKHGSVDVLDLVDDLLGSTTDRSPARGERPHCRAPRPIYRVADHTKGSGDAFEECTSLLHDTVACLDKRYPCAVGDGKHVPHCRQHPTGGSRPSAADHGADFAQLFTHSMRYLSHRSQSEDGSVRGCTDNVRCSTLQRASSMHDHHQGRSYRILHHCS